MREALERLVRSWTCDANHDEGRSLPNSPDAYRSCIEDLQAILDDHAASLAEEGAEIARLREQLSHMALDALAADTQAFEAYEKQIVAEAELARVRALEQKGRAPHMDEAARLRKGLERIRDSTFRSAAMLRAAADATLNGGTPE